MYVINGKLTAYRVIYSRNSSDVSRLCDAAADFTDDILAADQRQGHMVLLMHERDTERRCSYTPRLAPHSRMWRRGEYP